MLPDKREIVELELDNLKCSIFDAGGFKSDAGAGMGVLPRVVWEKNLTADTRQRIRFATNLMLIRTTEPNILIDTGIGYFPDEKIRKIYSPEPARLLESIERCGCSRDDIDFLILTHLHHDHIGGILNVVNEQEELMFPKAKHIIQKKEWETAINPDELNRAAYRFDRPIKLLQKSDKLLIIDGEYLISPEIKICLAGGHSNGTQIIRIESKNNLCYYPGDIIPHELHLQLPVTSAYDVNRYNTFLTKKAILNELKKRGGYLILNHQSDKKLLKFPLD